MNHEDWYTDRMDVFRAAPVKDGALSKHQRVQVAEDVPCRIYRPQANGPRMQSTAAAAGGEDKLACANEADVLAGAADPPGRGAGAGPPDHPGLCRGAGLLP
jgi:hypothetical protein